MIVAIDYDGTITSNFAFYQQLCHMLQRSGHIVMILSGCNPKRRESVKWDLERMCVPYDQLICRDESVKTGPEGIGSWKKKILSEYNVSLWFDNEVKNYEDAGIDFGNLSVEIMRP